MKTALITGIGGQAGSYLAELLLSRGYSVHGFVRSNIDNIAHIIDKVILYDKDLSNVRFVFDTIDEIKPDEIYHLAAQSSSTVSFDLKDYTSLINSYVPLQIINHLSEFHPEVKFLHASSAELFGFPEEIPQNENTPFKPVSPYAIAKLKVHQAIEEHRENGFFFVNAILFNAESPRRKNEFVTKKIVKQSIELLNDKRRRVMLGNLQARRDWGYMKEYVEAMHLMLQYERAEDFVIATGVSHTVEEFCSYVFDELGHSLSWVGDGEERIGYIPDTGKIAVGVSPSLYRKVDHNNSLGNISKAKDILGWQPKTSLRELVHIMVEEAIKTI